LDLVPGRPAGISFLQVAVALLNWREFALMLGGMLIVGLLFWNVGSGRLGKPACACRQRP
jgi:hypothetical protein